MVSLPKRVLPSVIGPPSEKLEELGLTNSAFYELVSRTKNDQLISSRLRKLWFRGLGLRDECQLPPNPESWFPRIKVKVEEDEKYEVVRNKIPEDDPFHELDYIGKVDYLMANTDDSYWQCTFPFRVKGDAPLRRCRLADFLDIFEERSILRTSLLLLRNCRSYIFVCNMLFAEFLSQSSIPSWSLLRWLDIRGALQSINYFTAYSKEVSTSLKTVVYPDSYLLLVEMNGMAGYRLLPDPGFDIVEATRDSATGFGDVHSTTDGLKDNFGWQDCADILYVSAAGSTEAITFEDFVYDARAWTTSGSSSVGRMDIKIEGGRWQRLKARKLMLPYCSDAETLIAVAKSQDKVVATSLVKSELTKIRLAVASCIGFYLVWMYLHHFYGDLYSKWPGVTLNESTKDEMERLYAMVLATEGGSGFPADFQSFDAQPLTSEIAAIGRALISAAKTRTTLPAWLEFRAIDGLVNSVLQTPPLGGSERHSFPVKNYLPSGIAITSAVGNGFNSVASESMIRLVEAWTGRARQLWLKHLALRGDDSSFIASHEGYNLLLSLAAKLMSYRHAPNKVSLLWGGTELLRVQISKSRGCRGYPARLIPTLTQRKPWSNEPWDPEGSIVAQWNTCCALTRRRQAGSALWDRLRKVWARKRGVTSDILGVPSQNGGLGLGKPVFATVTPKIRSLAKWSATIKLSQWAPDLLRAQLAKVGVTASMSILNQASADDAVATLGTVDHPDAAHAAQESYHAHLSQLRVIPRNIAIGSSPPLFDLLQPLLGAVGRCDSPTSWREAVQSLVPVWLGQHWELTQEIELRRKMGRYELVFPPLPLRFEYARTTLMRRFRCPAHIAEDWLLGVPPGMHFGHLHPNLMTDLSRLVCAWTETAARGGFFHSMGLVAIVAEASWHLGIAATQSTFHQLLYSW